MADELLDTLDALERRGWDGTARRDGEVASVATMSSVYVQVTGSWRLALHTQTPVPG